MNIKSGLQTITWGDPQEHLMDNILATAIQCGYHGVEIGWRRILATGVENMALLLEKHDIQLVAGHIGGNLVDLEQAENERQKADDVLDGIRTLQATKLLFSGLKYVDDDQFEHDLASLNALALRCTAHGVQLLYHNHDWEFTAGGRVFDALLNRTPPELGFCPDVGWIHKAGMNCVQVLERIRDRVDRLHFKDFRTRDVEISDPCCLGEGCVPFAEIVQWVNGLKRDEFWIIAEQDRTNDSPEDAAAHNATFVRECFNIHTNN